MGFVVRMQMSYIGEGLFAIGMMVKRKLKSAIRTNGNNKN